MTIETQHGIRILEVLTEAGLVTQDDYLRAQMVEQWAAHAGGPIQSRLLIASGVKFEADPGGRDWHVGCYSEERTTYAARIDVADTLLFQLEHELLGNVTQHGWLREARRRFGHGPKGWRFRCVQCSAEYSVGDFVARGADPQRATSECIGRLDLEAGLGTGSGCDWATFGLIETAGTVRVVIPNGSLTRAMPFAATAAPVPA